MRFLLFFLFTYNITNAQAPDISILKLRAPETFKAIFKTTKGDFVIEAYRKWSPQGVDRLYQLISSGFYNRCLFFRVEPGFVVQFGISGSRPANSFWDSKKLPDEPAQHGNKKDVICFARGGKNDRSTQLFINLADNPKLDTEIRNNAKGYAPVARVISGMGIIARFNARYGKKPAAIQDSLYKYGSFYFEEQFPGLDRINNASIIK
jgi:peptidyl-prolyl cis-trans isomerase A (cyclophilin A)